MPLISNPGQRRPDNSVYSAQVRAWVREFINNDELSVIVTEAACNEDSCSPLETLIAIMSSPPQSVHIDKALADVTQNDVIAAFGEDTHPLR